MKKIQFIFSGKTLPRHSQNSLKNTAYLFLGRMYLVVLNLTKNTLHPFSFLLRLNVLNLNYTKNQSTSLVEPCPYFMRIFCFDFHLPSCIYQYPCAHCSVLSWALQQISQYCNVLSPCGKKLNYTSELSLVDLEDSLSA